MTQLGQLYEKEKIEYGNQKAKEKTVEMAKSMLDEGIDFIKIMKVTGLTERELLHLQDENVMVFVFQPLLWYTYPITINAGSRS